jgi:hypothetical protein
MKQLLTWVALVIALVAPTSVGATETISGPARLVDADTVSIGPLIAVCCQATILLLSSDTPVAIAPSELVRLRRRSDRGWRDDCLAGLAIDVVGGFVGLG